jgi:hypothetical protein
MRWSLELARRHLAFELKQETRKERAQEPSKDH